MLDKFFFTGRYKGYSLHAFQKDLISGVIVGIIAIPLGMAFAIASGVKPEYGLYTTIIAGILISLFGGSRFQIGGPTGAFIPILFGIVMTYGYENLLIAGFLAGFILILMGLFKLGALISFIPRPVTIGFTSGIAVIIFAGQIPNFLGLEVEKHEAFVHNVKEIFIHISETNGYSVLTAGLCLAAILFASKFFPKIPGALLGLIFSTLAASLLYPGQVATIGSTFGEIPNTLPAFKFPEITMERLQQLIRPAFAIAILGAIESLLSAVVADGMTKSKHNSHRELIGQGLANMAVPLFGGIPATGAIARTATNIKSGAVSPISGVIHGLVVLSVLLLFAPYASQIPLASMAPILMVVAWNMSQRHIFYHVLKTRTEDSLVLVVTFLLTVFMNLVVAVEVGLILAIVIFTKRMSDIMVTAKALPNPKNKHKKVESQVVTATRDCPQISIYNIEGPLFFGAALAFEQTIMKAKKPDSKVLLLRMGRVPYMDATGAYYFSNVIQDFLKQGVVLISGINEQPKKLLKKTGLYESIGEAHFFERTGMAIDYALSQLNENRCLGCTHFAFTECRALSGTGEKPEKKASGQSTI